MQEKAGNNRLIGVTGLSGSQNRTYEYDENGNLLKDSYKDITKTTVGRASYTYELIKGNEKITYLYSSADQRTYKKVELRNSDDTYTTITEEYYLMDGTGKTIAIKNLLNGTWEYFLSAGEREARLKPMDAVAKFGAKEVQFYAYDHLGNTRVTYSPVEVLVEIDHVPTNVLKVQIDYVADYFPYGKILREFSTGQERYLTTQHERDLETGLDYRGARYYDSDVARFLSVDPLSINYFTLTTYNYLAGNPIIYVDYDGKKIVFPSQESRMKAKEILMVLGLENEFKINNRGVLKKQFTPFQKSDELTKEITKEVRSRKITEVSITDKNSWSIGNYTNSDSDVASIYGTGSAKSEADFTYEGFPFMPELTVNFLVVSSENGNKSKEEMASSLVGGLLDNKNPTFENQTRSKLGINLVEDSSVKEIGRTSSQNGSVAQFEGINRTSRGDFNIYYKFFASIFK